MKYLGGKARKAKEIAAVIAPRGRWLEPFCGGQSMTVALSAYAPGDAYDAHPALISLYCAVLDGWDPPSELSEMEFNAAKALPNSNPLKAFAAFGCAFGGRGGFARRKLRLVRGKPMVGEREAAAQSRSALIRDAAFLRDRGIRPRCASFFDIPISQEYEVLYCDPPYAGTTGYSGTAVFDHERFWSRCREWAATGVRVFVSEYTAPLDAICVWSKGVKSTVSRDKSAKPRVEKLFELPRKELSMLTESECSPAIDLLCDLDVPLTLHEQCSLLAEAMTATEDEKANSDVACAELKRAYDEARAPFLTRSKVFAEVISAAKARIEATLAVDEAKRRAQVEARTKVEQPLELPKGLRVKSETSIVSADTAQLSEQFLSLVPNTAAIEKALARGEQIAGVEVEIVTSVSLNRKDFAGIVT